MGSVVVTRRRGCIIGSVLGLLLLLQLVINRNSANTIRGGEASANLNFDEYSRVMKKDWYRYSQTIHNKLYQHWHHGGSDSGRQRLRQQRRVLVIQYFSTNLFNTISTTTTTQRYARNINREYAEYWGYDSLQITTGGAVNSMNRTQNLLEILDDLETDKNGYDFILLLPNEGILLNDFQVDITTISTTTHITATTTSKMPEYPSFVVYSHCSETNNNNGIKNDEQTKNQTLTPLDFLWENGMTLWKLPNNDNNLQLTKSTESSSSSLSSFPRLLRSMLSSSNDNNNTNNNNNDKVLQQSCFPKEWPGQFYCDTQQRHSDEIPPIVTWYNYSTSSTLSQPSQQNHKSNSNNSNNINNNNIKQRQPRLLIGQYSGHGIYASLLNITSQISRRYCRKWKMCDVLVIQGKPWEVPPLDTLCRNSPAHRASFTKITLLKMALQASSSSSSSSSEYYYDFLLLLDADAFVYNWNFDIRQLLTNITTTTTTTTTTLRSSRSTDNDDDSKSLPMMTAHRVYEKDPPYTWHINNGVTLWNLRHPKTELVTNTWNENAVTEYLNIQQEWRRRRGGVLNTLGLLRRRHHREFNRDNDIPPRVSDQKMLYKTLKELKLGKEVYGNRHVMAYDSGTVVKHLIRSDSKQWGNTTDSESRYGRLKKFSKQLCKKYKEDCVEPL